MNLSHVFHDDDVDDGLLPEAPPQDVGATVRAPAVGDDPLSPAAASPSSPVLMGFVPGEAGESREFSPAPPEGAPQDVGASALAPAVGDGLLSPAVVSPPPPVLSLFQEGGGGPAISPQEPPEAPPDPTTTASAWGVFWRWLAKPKEKETPLLPAAMWKPSAVFEELLVETVDVDVLLATAESRLATAAAVESQALARAEQRVTEAKAELDAANAAHDAAVRVFARSDRSEAAFRAVEVAKGRQARALTALSGLELDAQDARQELQKAKASLARSVFDEATKLCTDASRQALYQALALRSLSIIFDLMALAKDARKAVERHNRAAQVASWMAVLAGVDPREVSRNNVNLRGLTVSRETPRITEGQAQNEARLLVSAMLRSRGLQASSCIDWAVF